MSTAVNISAVSKSFGKIEALKDISLDIKENELFGFIGPDGAGKTSLFRILTTLLIPDIGKTKILGMDVVTDYRKIRPLLGYMPGKFSLYEDLSVEENMRFFASVFGTTIEENYELVKPIYSQLERFKNRLAGNLSGGMKQKLALSCALIHKPEVLILDEPTTGVDAVSRKEFWEMLHLLKDKGITIIASTPYMDEAKQCDRIALIDKGSVLKIDTPDEITKAFEKPLYGVSHPDKYKLISILRLFDSAESVHPFGEFVHYTDKRGKIDTADLEDYLSRQGLEQSEVKTVDPDIEDVFMSLMKPEEAHV